MGLKIVYVRHCIACEFASRLKKMEENYKQVFGSRMVPSSKNICQNVSTTKEGDKGAVQHFEKGNQMYIVVGPNNERNCQNDSNCNKRITGISTKLNDKNLKKDDEDDMIYCCSFWSSRRE